MRTIGSYLKNYLVPYFGKKSIKDIVEGTIDDFLLELPDHLSPKTRSNILGVLSKIFHEAFRRHDIGRIPDFPKIDVPESEIKFLSPEEQEEVLAHIADPIMQAFFIFSMGTGVRQNEARALMWKCVNLQENTAVIKAGMDEETFRDRTKEGNVRLIALTEDVVEALNSLPRSLSGFVFDKKGKPVTMKNCMALLDQSS